MTVSVLKSVITVIAGPLTLLINDCLKLGIFPDILKQARTVPIFKKGDRDLPSNYRPISILPIFGKVMEAVMKR